MLKSIKVFKSFISKMFLKLLFIFVAVLVRQSLATATAPVPAPIKLDKGGFLLGDRFYSIDNTANRNRAQALVFCESKGGELAKLTGKPLFNIIQASTTTTGAYWIDGIDKTNSERWAASHECTDSNLDFSGIPKHKLDFKQFACLSFFKGHNATTTKIEAISCSSVIRGVVCSTPLNGCEEPSLPISLSPAPSSHSPVMSSHSDASHHQTHTTTEEPSTHDPITIITP